MHSQQLIYSVQTESFDPGNAESLGHEYGQLIEVEDGENKTTTEPENPNEYLLRKNEEMNAKEKQKKEYTPIKSYKPSGNLLYNDEILNRIGNKLG